VVPPFVGVAVNVTLDAGQIGFAEADIFTLAGKVGLTIILIAFEVAVVGTAQAELEVNTQVMTSPFTNTALVYVVLLIPTFTPFNFH
jgi:hypothetical protein